MKVWEETWRARFETHCQHSIRLDEPDVRGRILADFLELDDDEQDPFQGRRAKLAAAAPEMARLLLQVAALRDSEDARDVAKAICLEMADEVEAVLRKAGVLQEET